MTIKEQIKKPVLQNHPAYDWSEIDQYILAKYGKSVRDWAGKWKNNTLDESKPYQDFWHWLCEHHNITDGIIIYIDCNSYSDPELAELHEVEPWIVEILEILYKEFNDDMLPCYCSW